MNALFISYNSAIEPLLQSQGIPHMRELTKRGMNFALLSFEKRNWTEEEKRRAQELKERLNVWGIEWHALRYLPSPLLPASTLDILRGVVYSSLLILRKRIRVIHTRSYIPAAMALVLKKILNVRFIFDMRGLMADEYVSEGHWTEESLNYKIAKWVEKICLKYADSVIVTSNSFAKIVQDIADRSHIRRMLPISVVTNSVDITKYSGGLYSGANPSFREDKKFRFIYSGSTAKWHLLPETMDFFKIAKSRIVDSHLIILSYGDRKHIESLAEERGISDRDCEIRAVNPDDVPGYLMSARVGLSFIKPTFTKRFASPIKFAEYLAAGLPVVINKGIGDTEEIVRRNWVGIIVEDFSDRAYERAVDALGDLIREGETLRERCRSVARKYFSLEQAVGKYEEIYKSLT